MTELTQQELSDMAAYVRERQEKMRPANEALKEALPSYHRPMPTIDIRSFEAKHDPVTAVINLRADVRRLEAAVESFVGRVRDLDRKVGYLTMPNPTIRSRIARWWRAATAWARREEEE